MKKVNEGLVMVKEFPGGEADGGKVKELKLLGKVACDEAQVRREAS